MKILSVTGGLASTNGYLIIDDAAHVAVAIDAPRDTFATLLPALREAGADLQLLVLTHGHWDHIGDHAALTQAFPNAKVLISKTEEPRLQTPSGMGFKLPYTIPPRPADGYIEDAAPIVAGAITLIPMHTPGHSAGHMALYWPERSILFAGDLLMADSVGRYDLPDSDFDDLKGSLRRVLALPENTAVLSGHGPATSIGRELHSNPFIQAYHLNRP